MAHYQIPGPLGFDPEAFAPRPFDHNGVIGRAGGEATPPGPVGTTLWQKQSGSSNSAATGGAKGIRVHPNSQISAQDWVDMIQRNQDMPDYFAPQIKAKGNAIIVTSTTRFRVPKNVIMPDWLSDWLSAFSSDEWEITTGVLDVTVTKGDPSKKGDAAKNFIKIVHLPDLASGETVSGLTTHSMTSQGRSTADIQVERGNTLPTGVSTKSRRKLIVVANRVTLRLGKAVKTLQFEESELVEVWFHELAAHAGRNSQGLPDTHQDDGKGVPDKHAKDIEDRFPSGKTVARMLVEIKDFLK